MDELGPEEQQWLDVLRKADEPSAEDRARVRSAVVLAAMGGTTALAAGTAKAAAVGKAAGMTLAWKVAIVTVALAGAGTMVGMSVRRSTPGADVVASAQGTTSAPMKEPTSAGEPSVQPSPPSVIEEPALAPITQVPSVASSAAVTARPSAPRASASPPKEDLDAEVALMTDAHRALAQRSPRRSLELLDKHRREHPRGAFSVERDGLTAIASCEAKRADGKTLATRFIAAHPSSPLVARVRATCLSP